MIKWNQIYNVILHQKGNVTLDFHDCVFGIKIKTKTIIIKKNMIVT